MNVTVLQWPTLSLAISLSKASLRRLSLAVVVGGDGVRGGKVGEGQDSSMLTWARGSQHIQIGSLKGRTSSEHPELEPICKLVCELQIRQVRQIPVPSPKCTGPFTTVKKKQLLNGRNE